MEKEEEVLFSLLVEEEGDTEGRNRREESDTVSEEGDGNPVIVDNKQDKHAHRATRGSKAQRREWKRTVYFRQKQQAKKEEKRKRKEEERRNNEQEKEIERESSDKNNDDQSNKPKRVKAPPPTPSRPRVVLDASFDSILTPRVNTMTS